MSTKNILRFIVFLWLITPLRAAMGATNLEVDGYLTTSSATLTGGTSNFALTLSTGIFLKGGCITFKDGTQQCKAAIGIVNSADNTFTGNNTHTGTEAYGDNATGAGVRSPQTIWAVNMSSVTRSSGTLVLIRMSSNNDDAYAQFRTTDTFESIDGGSLGVLFDSSCAVLARPRPD